MTSPIIQFTQIIQAGRDLTAEQSAEALTALMSGQLTDEEIAAFLAALADKGETVEEIVGAAVAMRRHAVVIPCLDPNAIDTCGTGGDGISTFNVSTAAAIIAAAAAATVAKHGNRSISRASGSAEVMQALGVNIEAPPDVVARCLREVGFAFLYAPLLHPAMQYVAAARRMLNRRTIFNFLGPLTNPAGVRRQIVGVPHPQLMDKIAEALHELGAVHAFVVHGDGGLCDLSISGSSDFIELREGQFHYGSIKPADLGLTAAPIHTLAAESPQASAAAIRAILAGEKGPRRDHALLNAAPALVAAGLASSMPEAAEGAAHAIDSGAAAAKLQALVSITGATA
jgi:anthranilate phosphoribosyltransferase